MLWLAVYQGDAHAVAALINDGVDVNDVGNDAQTPLIQACYRNSCEVVRLLIEAGADMQARTEYSGDTPLIVAAQMQNQSIVRLLALRGAHTKQTMSAKWQENRCNIAFVHLMTPYIKQARSIAKERTLQIRALLEHHWRVPKVISQLIFALADTEWHNNSL